MKNETKKLFVIVMVIAILALIATNVLAADDNRLSLIPGSNNSNSTTNETTNTATNSTTNTTNTTNTTSNITTPTLNQNRTTNTASNTTTSTYQNQNLPKTGVTDDITITALVVICAVSAIFAYKKIRDYKSM